jgi:hypothetical protein
MDINFKYQVYSAEYWGDYIYISTPNQGIFVYKIAPNQ